MAKYIDADNIPYTDLNDMPQSKIRVWVAFKEKIDRMPAADVQEVRHGRWKPFDLTWGRSIYSCTACENAFEVPTEMGKPIYEYCPNCGARMEGEQDE